MKKFKKLTAAVAATLMAATMVAPMAMNFVSNAADYTLSIPEDQGINRIEEVYAYKLFDILAENKGDDAAPSYEYKVPEDKNNWNNNENMKAAIEYAMIAAGLATSGTTYATPQEALSAISNLNSSNAEKFAKALTKEIADLNSDKDEEGALKTGNDIDGENLKWDNGKVSSSTLGDGYYIVTANGVKENTSATDTSTGVEDEVTISLGMLTIIGGNQTDIGLTGVAKVGLPTVQKKVKEDDKGAPTAATFEQAATGDGALNVWNDQADLQIGQTATFRLYGTLPENYDMYSSYYYKFTDTLDKNFRDVVVEGEGKEISVKVYATDDSGKIIGTGQDVTGSATIAMSKDSNNNQVITVEFTDLKTLGKTETTGEGETTFTPYVETTSVIVVEYTTALKSTAEVAEEGMQNNKVTLTYSRNPNNAGSGDVETTPEDEVRVFTYDFEIDKTFFAGTSLTAQEIKDKTYDDFKFSIKNKDGDVYVVPATSDYGDYDYVIVKDSNVYGATKDMTLVAYDENGNRKTKADIDSDTDVSDWTLKIKIKGVDSEVYTVTEDQTERNVKEGAQKYNNVDSKVIKLDSSVDEQGKVSIYNQNGALANTLTVTYKQGASENSLTADDGSVDFVNESGVKLPETGGIGTTLFYLGGGAMVAFAGVALITKKRVGKKEA